MSHTAFHARSWNIAVYDHVSSKQTDRQSSYGDAAAARGTVKRCTTIRCTPSLLWASFGNKNLVETTGNVGDCIFLECRTVRSTELYCTLHYVTPQSNTAVVRLCGLIQDIWATARQPLEMPRP